MAAHVLQVERRHGTRRYDRRRAGVNAVHNTLLAWAAELDRAGVAIPYAVFDGASSSATSRTNRFWVRDRSGDALIL